MAHNVLDANNISTLTGKVNCLLQLVRGEANSKVTRRFESSNIWTLLTASGEQTPTSVGNCCFTNTTIRKKITTLFTAQEITAYLAAPSDDDTEDTIEEALHVLKIHMFGRDHHAGRNALVKLKR